MRVVSILVLAIAGLAVLAIPSATFMVRESEYGLVLHLGRLKNVVYKPGLHFKTPFLEDAVYLDRRLLVADIQDQKVVVQDKTDETPGRSRQKAQKPSEPAAGEQPAVLDGGGDIVSATGQRSFLVDAFATFRIVEPMKFYRIKKTEREAEGTLSRLLQESLRKVFGAQPFSAVLSEERVNLMSQIRVQLNNEASKFGVEVVDVRIKRADLPPANTERTFDRMKTSYEEQAKFYRARGEAEYDRILAEAKKDVEISIANARRDGDFTRARGDAKRNRIFAEAFSRDPEFFAFYRSMSAYRKALGSENTTFVLSPDGEFFRYFGDVEGRVGKRR